jgi:hypothetical protein
MGGPLREAIKFRTGSVAAGNKAGEFALPAVASGLGKWPKIGWGGLDGATPGLYI